MRVQRWCLVLGLTAAMCSSADAALRHRYSFSGNVNDSVGTAHGTLIDAGSPTAVYAGGMLDVSANTGQGSDSGISNDAYVDLPNSMFSAAAAGGTAGQLSVEIWAQSSTNRNWAAILSAGNSNGGEGSSSGGNTTDYIQLIPRNGANGRIRSTTHAANVGAEGFVDYSAEMSTSQITHYVTIFDQSGGLPGTVSMYIDGTLVGSNPIATGLNLGTMNDVNNWLGRSQWPDAIFDGLYDEVRIYDHALSANEVTANFRGGADTVVPEPASLALAACGAILIAARRRR